MKAMVMAAGVGSRLMPLTVNIPKPMVPMGNRPLMENTLKVLESNGFNDIIANLHYHPRLISDYFQNGLEFGVRMNYSFENELMGTAGGVKNCEWFLNDTFAVVSGDALTDANLRLLLENHRKKGALATIALKKVDEVEQYGVVITDESDRILKFQEKPKAEEALSNKANTGIYIFEPEIFRYIPPKQFYDFGKQVFPYLVKIGAPFYGVVIDNYWCDIGSLNTYRQAHKDILEGKMPSYPLGEQIKTSPEGTLLLGKDVIIGKNVTFKGAVVVGDRCVINDNTTISDTIIWDNSVIGYGAVLSGAVIGSGCDIGDYTEINKNAIIASNCRIKNGIRISMNQKVFNTTPGDLQATPG
ncbi:MAG: NDP-sugar synthase [Syntrophomonadaceae bacterium]|nr:NDP-sugar synthase [Syntrophomonadaceae bacterium]